ncbi:hypothetical protein SDC49_14625 [Lactobacillus sp. R2/2]|nr:hypothetical protein [Lactobacillus sp. R2/2]MEB3364424.1 hypothetical protein [Lactobacillus sp. R2/2]
MTKQDTFIVDIEKNGQKFHFDDAFMVTTTNHSYLGGGLPFYLVLKLIAIKYTPWWLRNLVWPN